MATSRKCIQNLEDLRAEMKMFFHSTMLQFNESLTSYANELDEVYKNIKISKVAGQSGCVVGGILAVIGFGLSFATFGASLGLCIAGGVIGGAGGVVTGGASIADVVKSREARQKADTKLQECNKAFNEILEKCTKISTQLEKVGDIDGDFQDWCLFWGNLMMDTGKTLYSFGWKMVANTVLNALKLGRTVDIASDVTQTAVPVFRTLGNTAKGFHIAGGVIGAVFLPIDIGFLVKDAVELHRNESHGESKKIRQAVEMLRKKCPSEKDIDEMIDATVKALRQKKN